jgi:hypothetical protein
VRLRKPPAFLSLLLIALAVPALSVRTQETDTSSKGQDAGTPRTSAEKYKAHSRHSDVSIGAELLTRKEISKEFAADVNRCCLVVQVAVYPNEKEPLKVSHDDFTLAIEGTDIVETPQDARTLSAKLSTGANGGVTTAASVGVGVEFGTYTDPTTGHQVHGHAVTTSASVGIGAESSGSPSAAEREREIIERELSQKILPEAKISVPVSGYLYFLLPKQKKPAKYRLEYEISGETLILPLS